MSLSIFSSDLDNEQLSRYRSTIRYVSCAILLSALLHSVVLSYVRRDSHSANVVARTGFSSDTKVLAVGGSHTQCAVIPEFFSCKIANVSHSSNDYSMIELTVKAFLRKSPNISVVIIELDPVLIGMDAIEHMAGGDAYHELGVDSEGPWGFRTRRMMSRLPLLSRPKATPTDIFSIAAGGMRWNSDLIGCTRLQSHKQTVELRRQNALDRSTAHNLNWVKYGAARKRNHEAFLRVIQLLADNRVGVILLIPPVHTEYASHRNQEATAWINKAVVDARLICDIDVWNFTRPDWDAWDDSCLRDADHVSISGARALAAKVGELAPFTD